MDVVDIGHRPNLTVEQVISVFNSCFGDKYQVEPIVSPWRNILVKKNSWQAVTLGLRQDQNRTSLIFSGEAPSIFVRLLIQLFMGNFIANRTIWKEVLNDVRDCVDRANANSWRV